MSDLAPAYEVEASNNTDMMMLRTQIKANGTLLFPNVTSSGDINPHFEIVILAAPSHPPNPQAAYTDTWSESQGSQMSKPRGYKAMLMYPKGMSSNWTAAAKGGPATTVSGALESLLDVTATALSKYRPNVLKDVTTPVEAAGGVIDESLVRSKEKAWKLGFR